MTVLSKVISAAYEILREYVKTTRNIQKRSQRVHLASLWDIHNAEAEYAMSSMVIRQQNRRWRRDKSAHTVHHSSTTLKQE